MSNGSFDSGTAGVPAVSAVGDEDADGIDARSFGSGQAVSAEAFGDGIGVAVLSGSGTAVFAQSQSGIGVQAIGAGTTPTVPSPQPQAAIFAQSSTSVGVAATSFEGIAVNAESETGTGVVAQSTSGTALSVIGTVQVQGNSVGSVTMAAGTTTLTVKNGAATVQSLIFLTPLDNPQAFLWISAQSAGSFTIEASTALPTPVTIVFLIIN